MKSSEYERVSLSNREYHALRGIFGMVNNFNVLAPDLEKRCKSTGDGWRMLRQIQGLSEKLMAKLLATVPVNKLKLMQTDLKYTVCEIKLKYDVLKREETEYVCVPAKELDRLVSRIMNYECLICDKCAKDAKKCPLYKDISATYPWEFESIDGKCPLAGFLNEV